jgi:flagellar biosynthetic protein FliP
VSPSPGIGLFAALAVTLGGCGVALWLLKRIAPGVLPAGRGLPLRVLPRVSLGQRQGVALLQVGGRVLLVSTTDTGASLLGEIDGDDRDRALAPFAAATAPAALAASGVPAASLDARTLLAKALRAARAGAGLAAVVVALAFAVPAHAQAKPQAPSPQAHITVPPPTRGVVAHVPPAAPARPSAGLQPPVVSPPPLPQVDIRVGEGKDQIRLSGAVGLVVFMGVLTLLPALFLLMTSFTRILIVLHFLRSALGTQTTPPGQLLVALAVLLTGVVMHPVLEETNKTALQPYFAGQVQQGEAYNLAVKPFRAFMLRNVREADLNTFVELSKLDHVQSEDDLPTVTIVSAFVVSELRTAFQMGFVLYLPFVVVDVIVASVLMSLGMFMLPPVMVSMPLKLLLFVLADGWTLVVQNLAGSFK